MGIIPVAKTHPETIADIATQTSANCAVNSAFTFGRFFNHHYLLFAKSKYGVDYATPFLFNHNLV